MEIVVAIFDALGTITTSVITWFTNLFTGVTAVFYDATTSELTLLGTLLLVGVAVSAFYFVMRWISSLIRVKTR